MPGVGPLCVRQEEGSGRGAGAKAGAKATPGVALSKGLWVRVVGLTSRPEMNGQAGIVRGFDAAKERWKVSMEDGSGTKLLKEISLEALQPEAAAEEAAG